MILIRLADDVNGRLDAQAGGICHFKAQFTRVTLAEDRRDADEQKNRKSLYDNRASAIIGERPGTRL